MWMQDLLLLIVGMAILAGGGEALVQGASHLARRLGISALVVGLTVVAFGTSAPEVAVSVLASVRGQDALAVGNIVGSCILNILLVLGGAAAFCPIQVSRSVLKTDVPVMLLVLAIFTLFAVDDARIDRWQGIVLLAGLVGYVLLTYRMTLREPRAIEVEYEEGIPPARSWPLNLLLVVAGIAGLVWGADLIVDGAVGLARLMGITERIIGLTIVAIGTSLPELATSLIAARRGQPDIAVGNVVGSNIFNILSVVGIAASIRPLEVARETVYFDTPMMLGTAVLAVPILRTGHCISRREGTLLLTLYVGYLAWTLT